MGFLANILLDLSVLAQSERTVPEKLRMLVLFGYYTLKFIIYRLFRLQFHTARFSGVCFHYYDFRSFYYLFRTIFLHEQYHFASDRPDPLIIDCGANLGFSVIYFKQKYPASRILAFEPNPSSLQMLRENIRINNLSSVQVYNLALCAEKGQIELHFRNRALGDGKASIFDRCGHDQKIAAPCDLLSTYLNEPIDLLKMDVEGAEKIILPELAGKNKLKLIKEMVIEYHHHLNPRQTGLADFLHMLENHGFDYQIQALDFSFWEKAQFQDVMIKAWRLDNQD